MKKQSAKKTKSHHTDKGDSIETNQWRTAKSTTLLKTSLDFHSFVGLNGGQQKIPGLSTVEELLED